MPRIYTNKNEPSESKEVCMDCFNSLREDVDYYDWSDAPIVFIHDQAEKGEHYTCHICNEKLTADNYDEPGF